MLWFHVDLLVLTAVVIAAWMSEIALLEVADQGLYEIAAALLTVR